MKCCSTFTWLLCLWVVCICAAPSQGDLIPNITAYSDRGPAVGFNLANLVNGAGLPGGVPTLDAQHQYPSYTNSWQTGPPVNLSFVLHDEYSVSTMCVWPWSSNASVSAKNVELFYSTDGTNYTPLATGPFVIPNVGNFGNQWQVRYDFTPPLTATHMRLRILDNWGYRSPSGFAYTGLNEVQFGGIPVNSPRYVPTGQNQPAQTGDGSASTGGVDFVFDNVTQAGIVSGDYNSTPISELTPEWLDTVDFVLPSDPLQIWNLEFNGGFDGDVTLTFCYDDTNLLTPEQSLQIYHQLPDSSWEQLPVVSRDLDNNTITVTTTGFSDFAIGVPEPATMSLLSLGGLALLRHRKKSRA